MRHIPNILSAIRLALVGVFIWVFVGEQYLASAIIFVAAFFTDILDGYLARRNNWISNVGKLLDPLADKLMVIAALFCFTFLQNWLPPFIFYIVLGKELLMLIGGLFMLKKNVVVYSDWYGKIAAGFFGAAIVLTFVKAIWLPVIGIWNVVVFIAAIVLAFVALVHYFFKNVMPGLKSKTDEGAAQKE